MNVQAAEEKCSTLKTQLDDLTVKFDTASKEIEKWKNAANDANSKIDGYKKMAADADKRIADAKDFIDNLEAYEKEMERLKEFEVLYQRASRELDDTKQELESLMSRGNFDDGGGSFPDDDLLEGMKGHAGNKGKRRLPAKSYKLSTAHLLGPWVKKEALTSDAKGEGEVRSQLLLVRLLAKSSMKTKEDTSISRRMADFIQMAEMQFRKSAGGGFAEKHLQKSAGGGLTEAQAERALLSVGLRKDFVKRALETEMKTSGPLLDKNAFTNAIAKANAMGAWNKIDLDRKGITSNASVITFLEECGYSAEDSEVLIGSADPHQKGSITEERFLEAWSQHAVTTIDVQPALPATTSAQVTMLGVASTKLSRAVSGSSSITFSRAKPQVATQTSDAEAAGRNPHDPTVPGGGSATLQPTPMGRLLEMKDQRIEKVETDYRAVVDQLGQLLLMLKARTDHHADQMAEFKMVTAKLKNQLHKLQSPAVSSMISAYRGPEGGTVPLAPGLKWESVNELDISESDTELVNAELAMVLQEHNEVSREDLNRIGLKDVPYDTYIKAGDMYLKPAMFRPADVTGLQWHSVDASSLTETDIEFVHEEFAEALQQQARFSWDALNSLGIFDVPHNAYVKAGDPPGSRWKKIGPEKPNTGDEIENEALATALQEGLELPKEVLDKIDVALSHESYIKVGDTYYQSAGDRYFKPLSLTGVPLAPGLQWHRVGKLDIADTDTEIVNEEFAAALQHGLRFSRKDLNRFGLSSLSHDCYVKVGDEYFKPAIFAHRPDADSLGGSMNNFARFPTFAEIYQSRSNVSVQVKQTRTKLVDLVQDFRPGSSGPAAPRSIVWLSKILHGILGSKMASDAVDVSMNLPMSSYAAFCTDWMRNRFGVEALVRKACLELESSLRSHRKHSQFVELLADFFDGKHSSAEQRAFLHCYSLVCDLMDRQRQPRDEPHAREIPMADAMNILNLVLPYVTDGHRRRIEQTIKSVASLGHAGKLHLHSIPASVWASTVT